MVNNWINFRRVVLFCGLFGLVVSMDMGSHMNHGDSDAETFPRPDIQKPVSRTVHWISTLLFLFFMPCISSCFAFAGEIRGSLLLQIISGIYSFLEITALNFHDNDGVENRTSKETGVFIFLLSVSILITGFLNYIKSRNGTSYVADRLKILYTTQVFAGALAGYVKICLAPIAMFGFCRNIETGQCIAHGIMGSSFILYGFIYSMVLTVPWIRRTKNPMYSQDWIDSWVMCIYGIINTFTEHRWGREPWFMHDYQHTAMGILWWAGGILGVFLSRNGKRTFIPSLIIMFTGWSMTQHHQTLEISTNVHYMFGLILTVGGALRIIEITILLKDKKHADEILSFQYLPPFCLVCAGCLFMSANKEQLELVLGLGAEHSAYIMVIISGAFLLYCWILFCLEFYLHLANKKSTGMLDKYDPISNEPADDDSEFEMRAIE